MVRATTSLETTRYDLKSIPEGWVELRPMTYGQFLHRRDMAMKMGISGSALGKKISDERIDMDIIQEAVTRYEFKVCITDHNLEDENGRKLSLSTPQDFERLDPRVGQEISSLIDEMNQWEDPKSGGGVSQESSESTPDEVPSE